MRSDDYGLPDAQLAPFLFDAAGIVFLVASALALIWLVDTATRRWGFAQARVDRDVQLIRMAAGLCIDCGARVQLEGACSEDSRHG